MSLQKVSKNLITSVDPGQITDSMMFRNRIINGDMRIDQRNAGASVTLSTTTPTSYSVDRWTGWRNGAATGMTHQRVAGFAGFPYALRMQRANGNTSTQNMFTVSVIESANILDLAGQTVTLSFYAKTGANYSEAASSINVFVYTSTALDQTSTGLHDAGWTGFVANGSYVAVNSTGTTKITYTVTLPSNVQSIAVGFAYGPTGTAGAADYVDITGVQLEKGTTATPFEFRPYGTELALCQRYYQKTRVLVDVNSAALGTGTYTPQMPVPMTTAMRNGNVATATASDLVVISGPATVTAQVNIINGSTYSSYASPTICYYIQKDSGSWTSGSNTYYFTVNATAEL